MYGSLENWRPRLDFYNWNYSVHGSRPSEWTQNVLKVIVCMRVYVTASGLEVEKSVKKKKKNGKKKLAYRMGDVGEKIMTGIC